MSNTEYFMKKYWENYREVLIEHFTEMEEDEKSGMLPQQKLRSLLQEEDENS